MKYSVVEFDLQVIDVHLCCIAEARNALLFGTVCFNVTRHLIGTSAKFD